MSKRGTLFAAALVALSFGFEPASATEEAGTTLRSDGSVIHWTLDRPSSPERYGLIVLAQGSGCLSVLHNENLASIRSVFPDLAALMLEKPGVQPGDTPDDDHMDYGRDDFASKGKLVNALSRDRAKDMASDYDPAQDYAERRGITFRARVAQIMRRLMPERLRDAVDGMLDGLRQTGDGVPGPDAAQQPGRESAGKSGPERQAGEDPEAALRRARNRALVRHARAVDAIFSAQEQGGKATPEQVQELHDARKVFEDVRPYGSHDAEAAYKKNPELATEAATGRTARAIRALQLETKIRTDPARRADRFVERWQELKETSQRQYEAGNISGYRSTKSAMGDMATSLRRDPQLESLLENRKRELGINFESGRRLGQELAFTHGIDLGRGQGLGL